MEVIYWRILMENSLAHLFSELGYWAIPASLLLNGIIHVLGFIPSVFLTTVNVLIWGPWLGGLLSWLGEVIGSVAAFLLYRKGIQLAKVERHTHWRWMQTLNNLSPLRQWLALILARLTPFIPAGAVNLVGALTTVPLSVFFLSTAIGKLPSMALEVWFSHGLIHIEQNVVQVTLTLIAVAVGYVALKKRAKVNDGQ
jgi:uncharacterized membrane protein YdjX (TVP38/TMEM64 family)